MQIAVLILDIGKIIKLSLIQKHLNIRISFNELHPSIHRTDNTLIQSRHGLRDRIRNCLQRNALRQTFSHRFYPHIAAIPCVQPGITEYTEKEEQGKNLFPQYIGPQRVFFPFSPSLCHNATPLEIKVNKRIIGAACHISHTHNQKHH